MLSRQVNTERDENLQTERYDLLVTANSEEEAIEKASKPGLTGEVSPGQPIEDVRPVGEVTFSDDVQYEDATVYELHVEVNSPDEEEDSTEE